MVVSFHGILQHTAVINYLTAIEDVINQSLSPAQLSSDGL